MSIGTEEIYHLKCFQQPGKREAEILFLLPEKSKVVLKINNENDTEVRMLINETLESAEYEVAFLYGNLLAGNYYIKLIIQTENIIDINSLIIQIPSL